MKLALRHYLHFLFGKGRSLRFDLENLLLRNPRIAKKLAIEIEAKSSAQFKIEQKDYNCFSDRLAFGGLKISYSLTREGLHFNCQKEYSWLKSMKRISLPLHLANIAIQKLLSLFGGRCDFFLFSELSSSPSQIKKWRALQPKHSPNNFFSFLL